MKERIGCEVGINPNPLWFISHVDCTPLVAKGSLKGLREGGCGCVDSSDTRVLQCRICRGRVVVNLWVNLTFGWWFLSLRSSLLGWGIENMFLFFFLFFINCIKVACYYIFFLKKND
jgi:hypothetical protein